MYITVGKLGLKSNAFLFGAVIITKEPEKLIFLDE